MADPTEHERLRQATQLQMQCSDYLADSAAIQRERWELLHRIIEDAGKQYSAMRLDEVEERFRDQGAPTWLSVILTVAVTFIPVEALAAGFISALTSATQQLLRRANRALLQAEQVALREQVVPKALQLAAVRDLRRLPNEIKRTEEMVARFADLWEPQAIHALQVEVQELGQALGKHAYESKSDGRELTQTDAPIVVVTQSLHSWIDSQVRVENTARKMIKDHIRDLFDIATSSEPAKEAKAKEKAARDREAAREPRDPDPLSGVPTLFNPSARPSLTPAASRRRLVELPKTNKDALDELSSLRDVLAPSLIEENEEKRRFVNPKDLRELQLMAESIIWATTYDFTPQFRQITTFRHENDRRVMEPAPLPKGLWKRLTERYIDPDEGKSYADVGPIDRLGTKEAPYYNPGNGRYSPELRLSHYFSQILYPKVNAGNSEVVQKLSQFKTW